MKLKQVIDLVDGIEPNAYTGDVKTAWINEVEGMVQTDVFLRAIDDIDQYTWADDQQTVLLVKPPHDKLYRFYLQAMIQLANAEYDRYQNTMTVFNEAWGEFVRWFSRVVYPAGREAIWKGYYLSAYGIAVAHGYSGTVEEWLLSLHGRDGTDAYEGAVEAGYEGTREEFFQLLAGVDTLAQEASGSAAAAAASAAAAAGSAQTAQSAKNAAQAAQAAAEAALDEFTTPTAEAETLPAGSPATAVYAEGTFTFGVPQGAQGAKGDRGDKGDTGETGAQGAKGDKGDKGDTGAQGIQGIQGVKGDKGDKGDQGDTGDTGNGIESAVLNADYTLTITFTDGTSYTTPSIRGAQGAQGIQGVQGVKGDKGDQGDQGAKGDTGATGAKGDKGDTGDDGYSPTVTVTAIAGGHRVTVTDASGTRYFDVMDGEGSGDMLAATYDPAGGARQVAFADEIPTEAVDIGAIPTTQRGAANGVATLDVDGKVPSTQLPVKTATVTLSASDWSNNTQTVDVTGVTASNIVQISASALDDADAWSGGGVWCTAQGAGVLIFTCETVPTDDITLNVLIWG